MNDERFDARLRDLLGAAGADAPTSLQNERAALHRSPATGSSRPLARKFVVAAAALALFVGVPVWRHSNLSPTALEPTPSKTTSEPSTQTSAQTSTSASTMPPADERCQLSGITEYDEVGSMHTVMPNAQPIDATVTIGTQGPYCSGDQLQVTITLHNRGAGVETIAPFLILGGGANKYPVAQLPEVELQPNAAWSDSRSVTIPAAPPGQYWLGLYGLGDSSTITLENPPLCDATFVETRYTSDGAGGTQYTFVTLTNVSDGRCLLGPVLWAGSVNEGQERSLGTPGQLAPAMLPPLPSRLLKPGESAGLVLATTNGCLDGTVVPQPIGMLTLHLSTWNPSALNVDLHQSFVQTACSFSMSGWGGAPP